jgi:phosphorylcholine metabolism protein LicD
MKIKITDYTEHEDGSASYKVDTDREGTELLVQEGLKHILTKAYEDYLTNESTAD